MISFGPQSPLPVIASVIVHHDAAGRRYFLELPVCEEAEPLPVGREERRRSSTRVPDDASFEPVHRTEDNSSVTPLRLAGIRRPGCRRERSPPTARRSVQCLARAAAPRGRHAIPLAKARLASATHQAARPQQRPRYRLAQPREETPLVDPAEVAVRYRPPDLRSVSSISRRASAASASRLRRSFSRHRRKSWRRGAGVPTGNSVQSGSVFSTPASVSKTRLPQTAGGP